MTERTETLTQASAPAFAHEGHYVDWSSILAGGVVASGIAFVFTTFGGAVGLTLSSPYDGDGSAIAALIAVGLWMLWTTTSSFMAGGYIAGRMQRRIDTASVDEVSVRDGIHGLAVWGVAILIGVFLLGASVDPAVQATAASAASMAGEATSEAARKYSIISAFVLAASLMIAGAAAYWAAGVGGQHRDEGRVLTHFGRWT